MHFRVHVTANFGIHSLQHVVALADTKLCISESR